MRSAQHLAQFVVANLALVQGAAELTAQKLYHEANGLVVMEAENTASSLGQWVEKNVIPNHTGGGYLEFTGNTPLSGSPNSPLEYRFKVYQDGLYFLHLHGARENLVLNGESRDDVANDCFVRLIGNFDEGPNAGNTHGAQAPLSLLKSNTKFFVSGATAHNNFVWSSGAKLDPGGHRNKRVAIYQLYAGETYTLVVSGRSQKFKLNRIVFRRNTVPVATAENRLLAETDEAPPSPLVLWRERHFGYKENAGQAADGFDADEDGEANFVEFATAQNPHAKTTMATAFRWAGSSLYLTFVRSRHVAEEGITVSIERTTSLVANNWSGENLIETVRPRDDDTETVEVELSSEEQFLRVKVTKPT